MERRIASRARRRALLRRWCLLAIVGAVATGAALKVVSRVSRHSAASNIRLCRAELSDFVHQVEVQGTLESASNVEIECQLENQDPSRGTMILEIVPEGTYVQPGDVLVRLDSAKLEEQRKERLGYCDSGEADMVRYQCEYENAKKTLDSYQNGTLVRQRKEYELEIFEAEEKLRIAAQRYQAGRDLYQKGFITEAQAHADKFAVDRAKIDLALAQTNLDVRTKFIAPRYIMRYQRTIDYWANYLKRFELIMQLRRVRLKETEAQLAKCVIRAPSAGQVVYANQDQSSYGPVVIEEGAYVRYNQVVMRLPDPKRMLVRATIDESRIALVHAGAKVTIEMDAVPGRKFTGVVDKVNDLPEPNYYWSRPVQQYELTIGFDGEVEGLRPGWTAVTQICVERSTDRLQLPIDAIFEADHRHFCVIATPAGLVPREVTIGASNGKTIVIEEGLESGQDVVAEAGRYRNQLQLPDPADVPDAVLAAASTPPRATW